MTRHDHKINNYLQDETMTPAQPFTLPPYKHKHGARQRMEDA